MAKNRFEIGRGAAVAMALLVTATHFAYVGATGMIPTATPLEPSAVARAVAVDRDQPPVMVARHTIEPAAPADAAFSDFETVLLGAPRPSYCQDQSGTLPAPMIKRCVRHRGSRKVAVAVAAAALPAP
jgi:hypothetical protein